MEFTNLNLEQAVLASLVFCLNDAEGEDQALDCLAELSTLDFSVSFTKAVFDAIFQLAERSEPVNLSTIESYITQTNRFPERNVFADVAMICSHERAYRNLSKYAADLKEWTLKRQIHGTLTLALATIANAPLGTVDNALSEVIAQLNTIQDNQAGDDGIVTAEQSAEAMITKFREEFEGRDITGKVALGLRPIDKAFGNFNPTDFIVVGGRPGMGKSFLASTSADHIGINKNLPVLFFTLEMDHTDVTERIVYHRARQRKKELMESHDQTGAALVEQAADSFLSGRIIYDNRTGLTIHQIRAQARKQHRRHGKLGAIYVDHLQKIRQTNPEGSRQATAEITVGLNNLAKELGCPVIALAQLNRNPEQRNDKRPMNSDLMESGVIEQEADVIFMIYNDEKYNPTSESRGVIEVICTKARHNADCEKSYRFTHAYGGFDAIAPDHYTTFPGDRPYKKNLM